MHFSITHATRYRFDSPVSLLPHSIRLYPRPVGWQSVKSFLCDIHPWPVGRTSVLDEWGNHTETVWFGEPVDVLSIVTRLEVVTGRTNPYDFIITEPDALTLPWNKPFWLGDLTRETEPVPSEQCSHLARELADSVGWKVIPFLQAACKLLSTFTYSIREAGMPHDPDTTLKQRSGSCRDLAWLLITLCRSLGIPSRFVSGYGMNDNPGAKRYLHAWAEVYLPGAGWREWDPTRGDIVGIGHVSLAAGPFASAAAPVTGAYIGDAGSTLDWDLKIRVW